MPGLFRIERGLLVPKAHYFLFSTGTAAIFTFLPTFLVQKLHLSIVQISMIYSALPFIVLLVKPLMGGLSDKLQKQKLFLIVSIVMTLVSLCAVQLTPGSLGQHYGLASLKCEEGSWVVKSECNLRRYRSAKINCEITCNSYPINCQNCKYFGNMTNQFSLTFWAHPYETSFTVFDSEEMEKSNTCPGPYHCENFRCSDDKFKCPATELRFYFVAGLMVISSCASATVFLLADAMTLLVLANRKELFGRQKIFHALGYGGSAIVTGMFMQHFEDEAGFVDFRPAFYILNSMLVFNIFISLFFPKPDTAPVPKPKHIINDIWSSIKRIDVIVFAIVAFCNGFLVGPMWSIFLVYIMQSNNNQALIGLVIGSYSIVGECILFFISGWVLKNFGYANTTSFVMLVLTARFLVYVFVDNMWWAVAGEACAGAVDALFCTALATYASIVATKGAESTMLGIMQSIYEMGVGFGTLAFGVVFDRFGGRILFMMMAGLSATVLVFHIITQAIITHYCGISPVTIHDGQNGFQNTVFRYNTIKDELLVEKVESHSQSPTV